MATNGRRIILAGALKSPVAERVKKIAEKRGIAVEKLESVSEFNALRGRALRGREFQGRKNDGNTLVIFVGADNGRRAYFDPSTYYIGVSIDKMGTASGKKGDGDEEPSPGSGIDAEGGDGNLGIDADATDDLEVLDEDKKAVLSENS